MPQPTFVLVSGVELSAARAIRPVLAMQIIIVVAYEFIIIIMNLVILSLKSALFNFTKS